MTPAKRGKKAVRAYVKHGVYKQKAEIKRLASRQLDRRKTLDRAILEWESAVIADLGGPENLTTLQAGMLRALAWDRLFLDSTAAAEYGVQFRRDIESFVSAEAVDAVTMPGRFELPPNREFNYIAFCDPSGGSVDSMTLAIAHHEDGRAVLDCIREKRPPFSPEAVVQEFAEVLQSYQVSTVSGDRYAGEWPREQFRKHGIDYLPSEKAKNELYLELLPAINSGQVELLDNSRLLAQLRGLERRTSRIGRDVVDHRPGAHDDLANALAGALAGALAEDFAPLVVVL